MVSAAKPRLSKSPLTSQNEHLQSSFSVKATRSSVKYQTDRYLICIIVRATWNFEGLNIWDRVDSVKGFVRIFGYVYIYISNTIKDVETEF